MNEFMKKWLLDALQSVRVGGPTHPNTGLCNNVRVATGVGWLSDEWGCVANWMREAYPKWPKYSGDLVFPVPGGANAYDFHMVHQPAGSMWDRNTEYGQLRWGLLDFLIEQLESEIEQTDKEA